MLIRKNVWELGGDWSDTLLWYARAVQLLKSRQLDDRTSWRFWAGMHGYHQPLWEFYGYKLANENLPQPPDLKKFWQQCQHGSWYFLPWHRGYIFGFEQLVQSAITELKGPGEWALPYWNYFKAGQSGLPPAFGSRDWPDGKGDNPLFVEQRWGPEDAERIEDIKAPRPVYIPLDAVDLRALRSQLFTGVAGGGDPGFGGVDTGFEHGGSTHGRLESQPHDQVHGLVGGQAIFSFQNGDAALPGLMSAPPLAGLDPIFWLHHANIDRLWETWLQIDNHHKDPGEPRWLNGPASTGGQAFVLPRPNGTEWVFAPSEVLEPDILGYTYDDFSPDGVTALVAAGPTPSGGPLKESVMSGQDRAGTPKPGTAELVGASDRPVNVIGKNSVASVQLEEGMRKKVSANLAAGIDPDQESERVLLNLENVRGRSDATVLKIYVGPENTNLGGVAPDHRVGSIGLFGVTEASEPGGKNDGQGLNYAMDITDEVSSLGISDLDKVKVRLEAVSPVREDAQVTVGRISIVRQGQ